MYKIRYLEKEDYYKNYLQLLSQLTKIDCKISYKLFLNTFQNILDTKCKNIYVMEDKNKIIATGSLIIEYKFIHNCKNVAHIEDIVVDNDYRGQNLGRKMIQYLIDDAKVKSCYKIILNCDKNTIEFYKKLGFIQKNFQMAKYF